MLSLSRERATTIAIAIVGRAITLERKPSKKKQSTDTKTDAKGLKVISLQGAIEKVQYCYRNIGKINVCCDLVRVLSSFCSYYYLTKKYLYILTGLIRISMNANMKKTQRFYKMKYVLEVHWRSYKVTLIFFAWKRLCDFLFKF